MHLTSTLFTVFVAALVSAQTEYPFPQNPECIDKCSMTTGSKLVDGYTVDPKSPNFLKSLDLFCDKTGANYNKYMNEAMECMGNCPKADLDIFMTNFRPICNWYGELVGKDTTTNALNNPKPTGSASGASQTTNSTPTGDKTTPKATNSAATLRTGGMLALVSLFAAVVTQF
ncbi:hypothetical protein K7432_005807 [Basidiobolus ranarum]|uniref:Secreted protein n=1 Tax=Basidiobolus ranarum TaxID=34480 RepID=A0ABR2W2P6_9FUNG